jgi:hypothetical protein
MNKTYLKHKQEERLLLVLYFLYRLWEGGGDTAWEQRWTLAFWSSRLCFSALRRNPLVLFLGHKFRALVLELSRSRAPFIALPVIFHAHVSIYVQVFFQCTGPHVLLKLIVDLKSIGWCVLGCWLTIYSI